MRVADDADHRALRVGLSIIPTQGDLFADRVFIRPKASRGGFVDHNHPRRGRLVLARELAAGADGDRHGLEVSGADDVEARAEAAVCRRIRSADDVEVEHIFVEPERKVRDLGSGVDAGHG